ncbi:MAG: DotA/TraY family protein [Alphaproteobacteria bacterium]|nr:DotA/TraY family protein [Alphaproteobacteria bacterium]MBU1549968.1 DotA/TraY family protein [Alphaproteobacteria bacterium]MBU2336576.1 DotA/TraY family protein [Alphaproteobacteria bacterium]MBU2387309.1 DotA/TraY family protein [Alphaproteobacteria bacterium]
MANSVDEAASWASGGGLLSDPGPHNVAWAWVQAIMPDGQATGLSIAFSVLSSTLVYIAAFLVGWWIIIGIVSSASSGKVLGDKYHKIWAPLRVVFGIGLMAPVMYGWSSSHYLARDLVAKPAINLGDATWTAYVRATKLGKHHIMPISGGGANLVRDVLESEICASVNNAFSRMAQQSVQPVWLPTKEGELSYGTRHWKYGDRCGAISMPIVEGSPGFTADREAAVGDVILAVRELARPYGEYFSVGRDVATSQQAMDLMIRGELPMLVSKIRDLGTAYDSAIAAAMKEELALDEDLAAADAKIVKAAEQEGFVTAGLYWGTLSADSQRMTKLTGMRHQRTKIPELEASGKGSEIKGSGQWMVAKALEALDTALGAEEAEIGLTANDLAASASDDDNLFSKIMDPVRRDIGEWVLSKGGDPGDTTVQKILKSDPIGDQISSGHTFMGIAEIAIVAALVPIIAAHISPADWAGLDGAATWAMAWIGPQLAILWIVGAVRAYIIPVLPAIYMVLFSITWLLAFFEAMILLVIWAFGWVRMHGDEPLADASKVGATLLFVVFLMPAIGVLSYIGAFQIISLTVGTLDVIWARLFYGNVGTPTMAAMGIGFVVITFLTVYLLVQILGQIQAIPQRIALWFGQNVPGIGDGGMLLGTMTAMTALMGRGVPGVPSVPTSGDKNDDDAGGKVNPRAADTRDIADSKE